MVKKKKSSRLHNSIDSDGTEQGMVGWSLWATKGQQQGTFGDLTGRTVGTGGQQEDRSGPILFMKPGLQTALLQLSTFTILSVLRTLVPSCLFLFEIRR